MQPVIAIQLMPYLSAVDLHNCLVVFPSWEIFARSQILLDSSEDVTWAELADALEKAKRGTRLGLLNGGPRFHEGCMSLLRPAIFTAASRRTLYLREIDIRDQAIQLFDYCLFFMSKNRPNSPILLPNLRVLKATIVLGKQLDEDITWRGYRELKLDKLWVHIIGAKHIRSYTNVFRTLDFAKRVYWRQSRCSYYYDTANGYCAALEYIRSQSTV